LTNVVDDLSVAAALRAIREKNDALSALCETTLDDAAERDRALAALDETEPRGSLHRVPYSLKDVWDVAGLPTTRGHHPDRERVATHDSEVRRAFEDAGAVLVGKSNLSDLAITPESESYVGGTTKNPRDPTRTAGGSSGGGAAAVAASMAAFDWGTDFGGSIRLPAAFCGVVGMRLSHASWPPPTEGRAPTFEALNGMGPIAKDLVTCRAVIEAAAPRLRRSAPELPAFAGFALYGPDSSCAGEWRAFERELSAHLQARGMNAWRAPMPTPAAVDRAFVSLIASHVSELFSGRTRELMTAIPSALTIGPLLGDRRLHPTSARVLLELSILGVVRDRDRARARRDARSVAERVQSLFDVGFVLLTPTTTFAAPKLGSALSTRGLATFAKLGNLVDATALSVPFGSFDDGLPRGLQLLGPAGSELRLLELAERVVAPVPGRG
jgi:Asp-tRNA(Asn)/Glu-tRNA(Gln) amidotransferase A subunit family amidase